MIVFIYLFINIYIFAHIYNKNERKLGYEFERDRVV